jgi:hypothetical protein
MRPFLLLFILFFFVKINLCAQDSTSASVLKINDWRQHLPWKRADWVTQSAEKVWFATEWAILELNKSDRAPRFITRTDGLAETGTGPIKYDSATKTLIITYFNSNIDLWKNGTTTNIPFIKKNTSILGDKKIYDIFIDGDAAWLCCGFGVSKLSLSKQEFEFTTFTGLPVRGMATLGDFYFLATDDGVYKVAKNGANLADFATWKLLGMADGLPADYASSAIATFQNQIVFDIDGKKIVGLTENGSVSDVFLLENKFLVSFLTTEGAGLLAGFRCRDFGTCGSGPIARFTDLTSAPTLFTDRITHPERAIEDSEGHIWAADFYDFFKIINISSGAGEEFSLNSPFTQRSQHVVFADGNTFVASGTLTAGPYFGYNFDGFYSFSENKGWQQFNRNNQPLMNSAGIAQDFWRMAWNKDAKKLWLGSFYDGLLEFDPAKNEVTRGFDKTNSLLQGSIGDAGAVQIGGLAYDSKGNLWVSNYKTPLPILVFKKDETWKRFSSSVSGGETLFMAIDKNDYKWFAAGTSGGIYVLDSGADIDVVSDDKSRTITSSNSVMPSNRVTCFAVDLDGDMWVGTDKGMVTFQCGTNILASECSGTWPTVDEEGFLAKLLKDVEIRCIAIDGANRKWVGTFNGLFVFSPDCRQTLAHFTVENSPLFDNIIADIAINGANGDVWISTQKGILTLRTDATDGTKVNKPTSYAYPNPVMSNYDGPIAINGLARDANIKIVDVNGQLVHEGTSLGGQAIWDCRDYLGRRVVSGVYLVFATGTQTFDQPEADLVAKIVVLN